MPKVTLNWKAPTDDGGSEITNYIVEYRAVGAFKWLKSAHEGTERTTVIKGLDAESLYEFRVSAVNKAGTGPPAESSMADDLDATGKRKSIYNIAFSLYYVY